jgi:hypothetical protein
MGMPLITYIIFEVCDCRFDIQARAATGTPTKNQMR